MGSIRISGDLSKLQNQINHLGELDKSRINAAMAQVVRTSTLQRFKTEKDPDEKSWVPSKRVRDIGGTTLTDTATLKKSLHTKTDKSGFALGTNLRYAATHQFGDSRTIRAKKAGGLHFQIGGKWVTVKAVRVTIPARPYLGISDDDINEMEGTLEDALSEE